MLQFGRGLSSSSACEYEQPFARDNILGQEEIRQNVVSS